MYCLSKICYCCLKNRLELINIEELDTDDVSYKDKLSYCLFQTDHLPEEFPKNVCKKCCKGIKYMYNFRKTYLNRQLQLRGYILNLKSSTSGFPNVYSEISINLLKMDQFLIDNDSKNKNKSPEHLNNNYEENSDDDDIQIIEDQSCINNEVDVFGVDVKTVNFTVNQTFRKKYEAKETKVSTSDFCFEDKFNRNKVPNNEDFPNPFRITIVDDDNDKSSNKNLHNACFKEYEDINISYSDDADFKDDNFYFRGFTNNVEIDGREDHNKQDDICVIEDEIDNNVIYEVLCQNEVVIKDLEIDKRSPNKGSEIEAHGQNKDILIEDSQDEDIQNEDIQVNDIQNDIQNEVIQVDDIQNEDIQVDDIQEQVILIVDTQNEDIQNDNNQNEDIQNNDIQNIDIQAEIDRNRTNAAMRRKLYMKNYRRPENINQSPIKISIKKINGIKFISEHESGKTLTSCSECKMTFPSYENMKSHFKVVHNTQPIFVCDFCDKNFLSLHSYKKHDLTHSKGPFRCKICNKLLTSRTYLKVHVRKHAEKLQVRCIVCGKGLTRKQISLKQKVCVNHLPLATSQNKETISLRSERLILPKPRIIPDTDIPENTFHTEPIIETITSENNTSENIPQLPEEIMPENQTTLENNSFQTQDTEGRYPDTESTSFLPENKIPAIICLPPQKRIKIILPKKNSSAENTDIPAKKIKIILPKKTDGSESTSESSSLTNQINQNNQNIKKRRPGRPRKNKQMRQTVYYPENIPKNGIDKNGLKVSGQKRKRGRPRKNPLLTVPNRDATVSHSSQTKCTLCNYTFASPSVYRRHYIRWHTLHECEKCKETFKNKFLLGCHEKTCFEIDNMDDILNCAFCDHKFGSDSELKEHLKMHENDILLI